MSKPPYRALRIVLGFLSVLMVAGGVLLIFSSKLLIARLFLHPPEAEISTLLLFTLKEMGGFALMLSVMHCACWRSRRSSLSTCSISRASILGIWFGGVLSYGLGSRLSSFTCGHGRRIQNLWEGFEAWIPELCK